MSRSILVKYSDRGLADDVFNGGLKLFKILFWFLYLFLILQYLANNTIMTILGKDHQAFKR